MSQLPKLAVNKDYMMNKIDSDLEDLERRLREAYTQAQAELEAKARALLARYERERRAQWAQVEAGVITREAYEAWCRRHIISQDIYRVQIESIAHDLTNVDQIAVAMVNNELPDVYCSSYNFGLFRGDILGEAAGYEGASFTLYNADALRILIAEDPDLIPWLPPEVNVDLDLRWNRTQIQNALTQGILQGEGANDIAARILPIVNNDAVAAIRTARTSFTSVENQARRDATERIRQAGIPMIEPWLATKDARTRDTHLLLDGTLPNKNGLYGEGIIPTGHLLRFPADPNGDPEQIYNCRCRVQSLISGIDYSHDDELYNQFLHDNYYNDWQALMSNPKREEMEEAVRRQQELRNRRRT